MFFTLIIGVVYGLVVFFTRSYNTPWDGACELWSRFMPHARSQTRPPLVDSRIQTLNHSPFINSAARTVLPGICLALYIIMSLLPVTRMTIQEYFGWSLETLQDRGHMSSAIVLAILAAWASLWKFVYVSDQGSIMF